MVSVLKKVSIRWDGITEKKEASGKGGGDFTPKEETVDLKLELKIAVVQPERRGERSTLLVHFAFT